MGHQIARKWGLRTRKSNWAIHMAKVPTRYIFHKSKLYVMSKKGALFHGAYVSAVSARPLTHLRAPEEIPGRVVRKELLAEYHLLALDLR